MSTMKCKSSGRIATHCRYLQSQTLQSPAFLPGVGSWKKLGWLDPKHPLRLQEPQGPAQP